MPKPKTRKIRNTKANRTRAARELGIPAFYRCRLVGNRLEFHAYGGLVLTWPPEEPGEDATAATAGGA